MEYIFINYLHLGNLDISNSRINNVINMMNLLKILIKFVYLNTKIKII